MASSAEVRHSRLPWPETTGTPLTGPAALRQAGVLHLHVLSLVLQRHPERQQERIGVVR